MKGQLMLCCLFTSLITFSKSIQPLILAKVFTQKSMAKCKDLKFPLTLQPKTTRKNSCKIDFNTSNIYLQARINKRKIAFSCGWLNLVKRNMKEY